MASAFAQGMESGTRLAKSWLDTYNQTEEKTRKRRAAEEIAAAGTTSLAELPEQPRVYTPEAPVAPAAPALGTGAYGTEEDYTSIQPQGLVRPQPAAPAATPPGTGFARGYTADQTQAVRSAYATGGAPAAERAATAQGVPTQGLTRPIPMSQQLARQADIYARNGLTDQAEQYRLKAYDVSRQEEQDARTREADARTKADYEQKQNTNNAAQWMAEQISSGRTADMTLIAEAQTKFKGNYDTLLSTTANVLGITDKIAKQKTDQLVNQINEAVLGGEASFNKLLGSFADPNKEDDITPKLMQVKGGVQVMYGNKPMSPVFTGADGISPLQQAGAFYINTAQGKPFETAIQMQNLAKGAAAIKASEATTNASNATVGLRNAQIGQIKEGSKNATERADIVDKFEALTPEEQAGPKGQGLIKQFNLLNVKAGGQVSLGAAPKTAGPVKMDDLDKENLRAYRDWEKDPRNAKLPQGQKDAYAARLGVTEFINRAAAGPQTGVGSNPYAAPQQGVDTTRAPTPAAPAAAPAPMALSTENTKILNRAGNTGYNVQVPDGTTQVMSISQLNKLGYQFPSGTGLQRAWYEDLLPRR
jgi:hypothetical protein